MDQTKQEIISGQSVLGIELGSTRIKAVLIDRKLQPIASGSHSWENMQKDGVWTYALEDVWSGLRSCYAELCKNVEEQYQVSLKSFAAIGISGMMHGYLVFDEKGELLAPFRTWRNNITSETSEELTELFQYPIPQRWSIAHLYQSILKEEAHIPQVAHMTTLAGYVHWKLTGRQAMGIGEASGMFPIDLAKGDFDAALIGRFDSHVSGRGHQWNLGDILPEVLRAGQSAGHLTQDGAHLLDLSGTLEAGIPLCPPEGDAGTGMVATNSIAVRTGNVSAGTSVFAMLVLEKPFDKLHEEIDLVTTPDGKLVAMAHSNNCTSDLNAWMEVMGNAARSLGAEFEPSDIYDRLLPLALEGDSDCGGLLSYGYISGEHVTGFSEGRPLFVRSSDSHFTLANFMRMHLFSALCALRTGLNILFDEEGVEVDEIRGHGGFFKTEEVGQRIMAAATNTPVSVLETAGEGGAWGIALLAAYLNAHESGASLDEFLKPVFTASTRPPIQANAADIAGFNTFFARYRQSLPVERAAVDTLG